MLNTHCPVVEKNISLRNRALKFYGYIYRSVMVKPQFYDITYKESVY